MHSVFLFINEEDTATTKKGPSSNEGGLLGCGGSLDRYTDRAKIILMTWFPAF
jgi:hypothetical protein